MAENYISISCIPLPTFIQGGYAIFEIGENHPNRNDLPYFLLMIMIKGELFIAEDGVNYTLKPGDIFLLLPKHHHYSWKTVDQPTQYYWVHFSVPGKWEQSTAPVQLNPNESIPTLHYFTPPITIYLKKFQRTDNLKELQVLLNKIFKNSALQNNVGFWHAQEGFLDLLQIVQVHPKRQSAAAVLAESIEMYLHDHFEDPISNELLGKHFHVHPNSIITSMKKTFNITPKEYLTQYRLEEAVKLLLTTNGSINDIALSVGYKNIYYFSNLFKKRYGIPPAEYRKNNR